MTTAENFCLRWNDFESNVSLAFRELRDEGDFFDVNLACDETPPHARTLQAHKVILSACSGFFKKVLRDQMSAPSPTALLATPYLYLRGVRYNDLELLLDFMYHGEVNVAQEQLQSFLETAEDLQIKGLTNSDGKSKTKPPLPRLPTQPLPLAATNSVKKIIRKLPPVLNPSPAAALLASTSAGASPAKRPRPASENNSEAGDVTVKDELNDGVDPTEAAGPSVDELTSNYDEDSTGLGGVEAFAEASYGTDDSFVNFDNDGTGATPDQFIEGTDTKGKFNNIVHTHCLFYYVNPRLPLSFWFCFGGI